MATGRVRTKHLSIAPNPEMAAPNSTLLKTIIDPGVLQDSTEYTTLVIVHGWGFHAGKLFVTGCLHFAAHADQ